MFFGDKTLQAMTRENPRTQGDLLNISGMSPSKAEKFEHPNPIPLREPDDPLHQLAWAATPLYTKNHNSGCPIHAQLVSSRALGWDTRLRKQTTAFPFQATRKTKGEDATQPAPLANN